MNERKRTAQDVIELIRGYLHMNFVKSFDITQSCPLISINLNNEVEMNNLHTYVTLPNKDDGRIAHICHTIKIDKLLKEFPNDELLDSVSKELAHMIYEDFIKLMDDDTDENDL